MGVTMRRLFKLPKPTQDQIEYLERIRAATQDYDGSIIIGGPKKMPIRITDDPEVFCTRDELARYTEDYQNRFSMFAGKVPTLAEFIRREQAKSKTPLSDRMKVSNG